MDRLESVKMLTTSSAQYLSPDYLQPLPTTLDAKNSPLALLAQTCNSIGKDPPSKSMIPSLEKREVKTSSPADSRKATPPAKPREGRSSVEKPRASPKESNAKDIQHFYPISTSSPKPEKGNFASNVSSPKQESKVNPGVSKPHTNPVPSPKSTPVPSHSSHSERTSPRSGTHEAVKENNDNNDTKYTNSPPLKRARSESPPPARREYSPGYDTKHLHPMLPGYGPMGLPSMPFGLGGMQHSPEMLAALGYPYGLSGQNGLSIASAHASALAAHQAALKAGSSSAALAQYMQYARMRNPSLSSAPCKDPYCTNCLSSSVQPGHLPSQCSSPGCAQCSQEKSMQGLNMFGLPVSSALHSSYSASSLSSASAGLSTLHNLYTQNLLNQQQQQGHPHVCNWMSGSDYCGKRFSTSEELLQHLRSHTSGAESALSSAYGLGLTLPPSAELSYLSSVGGLSPESLRRMYPGSLSPLGSGALASRFHPYKSAMPPVPPGLPPSQSLGPYYSPYNIYGQRIGAAAVP